MTLFEWIRHNTQGITEAFRQVLYMLLGFEVLRNAKGEPWNDTQVALVLSAVSALLALVAAKTNVAAPKVQQRIEQAHAAGVRQGTGTGTGTGA